MAKKKQPARLSPGEMRLMGVLWEQGPCTLAESYELQPGQLAYTTIQTQLNRLVAKRLVARSKVRPMKYRALVDPQAMGAGLLQLLVDTVGGGRIFPLVEQLVSLVSLSREDVRELKRLIEGACAKPSKRPKSAKSAAKRQKPVRKIHSVSPRSRR